MWFRPDSCRIIAEIAQNHDGSLGTAHAYIDAVANTGADAIKFQTHIAAAESTRNEPWRVHFSRQDATRYEYWKRIEFTPTQWLELAEHARAKGLIFLSSPFSNEAFELLNALGMEAWKVGAGEITNLPMITRMAQTGRPVLLSSGLSGWEDLDTAVATVKSFHAPVGVFQCTSEYPCPPEKLGLNVIGELRERYGVPSGLSDHSGTIYAGLAAATLGAEMLEVHVTFSKECFGPDVAASITTGQLSQLVDGVRFIEKARSNPVDKEQLSHEFAGMRRIFGKSIVAARELPAGHQLVMEDLAFKKPGTGIPPSRVSDLIHRRLTRDLAADTQVTENDVEQYKTA
jgi:N-acetylneuraminate synthase